MVNSEISLGFLKSTIPIRSFQSLAPFSPVPPQESIKREKKKKERKKVLCGEEEKCTLGLRKGRTWPKSTGWREPGFTSICFTQCCGWAGQLAGLPIEAESLLGGFPLRKKPADQMTGSESLSPRGEQFQAMRHSITGFLL